MSKVLVFSGGDFSIRVTRYGAHSCGSSDFSQLGAGMSNFGVESSPPSLISPIFPWKSFVCGSTFAIGLTVTNEAFFWGCICPQEGQETSPRSLSPFVWKGIWCGRSHIIGITIEGDVYGWGKNEYRQLDAFCDDIVYSPQYLPYASSLTWASFFCGAHHTIGLTVEGEAYAWGNNSSCQLGIDHKVPFEGHPHRLECPFGTWREFSCGEDYSVGLSTEGIAYVWGNNQYGQLGLGDTLPRVVPTMLPFYAPWKSITCGAHHTVGITIDGQAFVWGRNDSGQLGVGDFQNRFSPHFLPPVTFDWSYFSCGDYHTIGVAAEEYFIWGLKKAMVCAITPQPFPSTFHPTYPLCTIQPPRFDLCHLLESGEGDGTVLSNDSDEPIRIHTAFLKVRCPQLLEQHPIPLARCLLIELLRMVYGGSASRPLSHLHLFELLCYVTTHDLIDFEEQLFCLIRPHLNDHNKVLDLLSLSAERQMGEFHLFLAHNCVSPPLQTEILQGCAAARFMQTAKMELPPRRSMEYCFQTLLDSGIGADFTIVVRDGQLAAHKFILIARNQYFKALLKPYTSEFSSGRVDLCDIPISYSSLKALMEFIYHGGVRCLSCKESVEILLVKEYFCLEDGCLLLKNCEKKIAPNRENCLNLLMLARRYDQQDLSNQSFSVVIDNYQFLQRERWQELIALDETVNTRIQHEFAWRSRQIRMWDGKSS